jgi:hypothetical protein
MDKDRTCYDESDARPDAPCQKVVMTFGKHKGRCIDEVPYGYVVWMLCGQNTADRYSYGNFGWVKHNEPAIFAALKQRLIRDVSLL